MDSNPQDTIESLLGVCFIFALCYLIKLLLNYFIKIYEQAEVVCKFNYSIVLKKKEVIFI